MAPILLLIGTWPKVFIPYVTRFSGPHAHTRVLQHTVKSALWALSSVVLYGTVMGIFRQNIEGLFPRAYEGHLRTLMMGWLLYTVVLAVRTGFSSALISLRMFKELAIYGTVAMVATLASTAILVVAFGGLGAPLGMAVGEVILTSLCVWLLFRCTRIRTLSPVDHHDGRSLATEP
jgi:O-antigen/teichoic acid export membrane protein